MSDDTILLLKTLGSSPSQMLSRGELRRRGVPDAMIDRAAQLGHVVVGNAENARVGTLSSMVSVILTDVGESALDAAEAGE